VLICPTLLRLFPLLYPIDHTASRLFFFQGSGDHQNLHSFPTRRSSDLAASVAGWPSHDYGAARPKHRRGWGSACLHHDRAGGRRSEEHTSELQSRRDLVCRLLLEKKKITKIGRESTLVSRSEGTQYARR